MQLLTEKKTDLFLLDPFAVKIQDGFNVREDYGDIEELANSIFENGLRTPLLVRRDKDEPLTYFIIEGHRRIQAIKRLFDDGRWKKQDEHRVRAILETKGSNDFDRLVDMAITNTGKPFTPIEFANLVKRLLDYGKKQKEIAQKLGISAMKVSNAIKLLELPESVKLSIQNGEMSASLALETVRKEGGVESLDKVVKERKAAEPGTKAKKIKKADVSVKAENDNRKEEAIDIIFDILTSSVTENYTLLAEDIYNKLNDNQLLK